MKKTVFAYIGHFGSGKTFNSMQQIAKNKQNGISTLAIAWADPLKNIIAENFNLDKTGVIDKNLNVSLDYFTSDIFLVHLCNHFYSFYKKVGYKKDIDFSDFYEEFCKIYKRPISDDNVPISVKIALSAVAAHNFEKNFSSAYRNIIQLLGTEVGRKISDTFWIDIVIHKIKTAFENDVCQSVVIDDTRFPNEFESLEKLKDKNIDVNFYGIYAPLEVRAKRLNMPYEKVMEMEKHDSEKFVPELMQKIPKSNMIYSVLEY